MTRLSLPVRAAIVALFAAGAATAQTSSPAAAPSSAAADAGDPYIWLETVDSPKAMD